MQKPTIHRNGTSATVLYDQLTEALEALRVARKAVVCAGPNARDYYPQGAVAYQLAENEHAARITSIDGVIRDLEDITEHVALQPDTFQTAQRAQEHSRMVADMEIRLRPNTHLSCDRCGDTRAPVLIVSDEISNTVRIKLCEWCLSTMMHVLRGPSED